MKNNLDSIFNLIKDIQSVNEEQLKNINIRINNIIKFKCIDENIISQTFDMLLSLVFVNEFDISCSYYKLICYTKLFNEELSDDYEKIFINQFDIDDKDCKKLIR